MMNQDEQDCYTKLSVEIKYFDGKVSGWTALQGAWDLNGDQLAEMFRGLMLAMGYAESTVKEVFNEEAVEDLDSDG
jgi:uncharacterized lipoprotein YmbA